MPREIGYSSYDMKKSFLLSVAAGCSLTMGAWADMLTPHLLDAGANKTRSMLKMTELSGIKLPKDKKELFEWTEKSARSGNAQGQLLLGNMYDEGIGVPRDLDMAAKWYKQSADNGNAYAAYILGSMYAEGEGVKQDKSKAASLFKRAADKGSMRAQFNLGEMYRLGDGVDEDLEAAARWYKKAAEQGMPQAQVIYAQMLESGAGVNRNSETALKMIRSALVDDNKDINVAQIGQFTLQPLPTGKTETALVLMSYMNENFPKTPEEAKTWAMGHETEPAAQALLGLMYEEGVGVESDSKKAVEWFERAAGNKVIGAAYMLARLYYSGSGNVAQDREKAAKLMESAANAGHILAEYDLGCMYYQGDGVPASKETAAKWFLKAASAEEPLSYAQAAIGYMLYEGDGITQNKEQGLKWLASAARLGSAAALPPISTDLPFAKRVLQPDELKEKFKNKKPDELAEHALLKAMPDLGQYTYSDATYYDDGFGDGWLGSYEAVDRDKVRECEKAAEAGDADSQYTLGCMYYSGKGKGRNRGIAAKWFQKAADQGNDRAQYAMGYLTYFGKGGIKEDAFKAIEWFRKAADKGNSDARKALDVVVEK